MVHPFQRFLSWAGDKRRHQLHGIQVLGIELEHVSAEDREGEDPVPPVKDSWYPLVPDKEISLRSRVQSSEFGV